MADNRFAEALMAFGDTVNNAFGGKQNIYGTYQEQKTKREQMEAAAKLAADRAAATEAYRASTLELQRGRLDAQAAGQQIALEKSKQAELSKNVRAGLRPIDADMSTSPGGRLPSRAVTGAYGQLYVPDDTMINLAAKKAAKTNELTLQKQKDMAKFQSELKGSENYPMNAGDAGRYTFAEESARNIPNVRNLLFKDGVFNQALVNKAIAGKYTKDPDVQNLKRWVVGTLTARGLIQSGTVIKDDEWVRLAQQYGVDLFSAPQAAQQALGEQERFFNEFMDRIKPGREKKPSSGARATSGKIGSVPWSIVK